MISHPSSRRQLEAGHAASRSEYVRKAAEALIADYGSDAEIEAAERGQLMSAIGHHDGVRMWRDIKAKIACELREQARLSQKQRA